MLENLCCESWCCFCRCFRWTLKESTCLTTTDHATSRHNLRNTLFSANLRVGVQRFLAVVPQTGASFWEVTCLPWPVLGGWCPHVLVSAQTESGVRIVELCGQPRTGAKSAATFTSQLTTLRKCHARAEETHRWSSVD